MLRDSRVKVHELDSGGFTPLWRAACKGHLEIIERWIAAGREMEG